MPKRLQVYPTPDLVVTFDPNLCMHSGVCLRGAPAVFDVGRSDWIRPAAATAAEVAAVVARCPSGALQVVQAGRKMERGLFAAPAPDVKLTASRNGPLLVHGPVTLTHTDGRTEERSGNVSLCRCGHTGNAPFCDGTHRQVGFKSPP
ncbi:MAG: (4Fe-4S)-binding protein [Gemmatimonadales bacterium]